MGPDLSINEAMLYFVFSRMRVIDELDVQSRAKMVNISFEDFLEVLIRIAARKVWPDDDETRAECEARGESCDAEDIRWHSAEVIFKLQHTATTALNDFVERHREPTAPPQPAIWERMENLILLIVKHIDLNHDQALGDKEVRRFLRQRHHHK